MSVELYKEVIGIISGNPDYEAIAVEIAKSNPKSFLDACDQLRITDLKQSEIRFRKKALLIKNSEGKIPCIKFIRAELGLALKESKEYMDAL